MQLKQGRSWPLFDLTGETESNDRKKTQKLSYQQVQLEVWPNPAVFPNPITSMRSPRQPVLFLYSLSLLDDGHGYTYRNSTMPFILIFY